MYVIYYVMYVGKFVPKYEVIYLKYLQHKLINNSQLIKDK